MENDFFIDLLKRYREGKATPEEKRLLETYYRSFDLVGRDITDEMSEKELAQLKEAIREGIATDTQPAENEKNTGIRLPVWGRMAAAAAIAVFCGMLMLKYVDRGSGREQPPVAGKQATARTNNLVLLPDGSTVILSSGSKLDFPGSFEGHTTREVRLEGEAFFDVKSNPGQPFIVHSGKLKTTVLGTSFNIKAEPGSESIMVTVISGKVQVQDEKEVFRILTPDEQIVYHIKQEENEILKVDAHATVIWKRDDLYCDDITVEQAVLLIEERYNVGVTIMDEQLKQKRFTTTFGKEEPLESVLNSVALFNDAVYRTEADDSAGTRITLSPK